MFLLPVDANKIFLSLNRLTSMQDYEVDLLTVKTVESATPSFRFDGDVKLWIAQRNTPSPTAYRGLRRTREACLLEFKAQ